MARIMIDPGHGGADRSNRGPTGYIEADGMLLLSKILRAELLREGFEVELTRDSDKTVGVRERGLMAAAWGADLLISQHSNATGGINSYTRGVEVYSSVDLKDDEIAAAMSKAIAAAMETKDRGAKKRESLKDPGEDYYGIIDAAQDAGVPHVLLIENGFHDHPEEEQLLKSTKTLEKIAAAQAEVLKTYFTMNWRKKIVLDALNKGLITDPAWIAKADEPAPIWFVCALAINALKGEKKDG